MIKFDTKVFKSIGKAFIIPPDPKVVVKTKKKESQKAVKKPKSKENVSPKEDAKDDVPKKEVPTEETEEIKKAAIEKDVSLETEETLKKAPAKQEKVKKPKSSPSHSRKPSNGKVPLVFVLPPSIKQFKSEEAVPLEILVSRRRSQIGNYNAAVEHSKYKLVPREFVDVFLRNALLDRSEYIYFNVVDAPFGLDPQELHDSVESFKNNLAPADKIAKVEKLGDIDQLETILAESEAAAKMIEKKGKKLIRQKERDGPPTNSKEKKERKDKVVAIKQLKNELNNMLRAIEDAEATLKKLTNDIKVIDVTLRVTQLLRHTNEDGRILQVGSFASWDSDSPEIDCRNFLLRKWNGAKVPLLGKHAGKNVTLKYRPSSDCGIILIKFTFPYADEGIWKVILQRGFLQKDDFIVDSTKALPVSQKGKMPALNDEFYVYVVLVLSLDQIPPQSSENYPHFRLDIKSNLKQCDICESVSHQTSRCPQKHM